MNHIEGVENIVMESEGEREAAATISYIVTVYKKSQSRAGANVVIINLLHLYQRVYALNSCIQLA